jgi:hypothetical protein
MLIVLAAASMVFLLSVWIRSVAVTAQRSFDRSSTSQESSQGNTAAPAPSASYARCKAQSGKRKIATITEAGSSGHIACPNGDCDLTATDEWYLKIEFFGSLSVTDGKGHTDSFLNEGNRLQRVPYVTYTSTCPKENCLSVWMPTSETYTLTFTAKANGEPILLDVVRGVGNTCPDEAVRYLDLMLPQASVAMLKITPQGVEDVRYDRQGNPSSSPRSNRLPTFLLRRRGTLKDLLSNSFRRHKTLRPCW